MTTFLAVLVALLWMNGAVLMGAMMHAVAPRGFLPFQRQHPVLFAMLTYSWPLIIMWALFKPEKGGANARR